MGAQETWSSICDGLHDTAEWWTKVAAAYTAPERHYHNLAHLERKLQVLQQLGGGVTNLRALTFALFFQYFEYNPRDSDTSEKNINVFKTFAENTGLGSEVVEEVESLLSQEGGGADKALLQDLDMSALALEPHQYHQLSQQVRKEYDFLSDHAYKVLRKKILQSFLLIPTIFSCENFRDTFESQARSNIAREVAMLDASS